MKDQVQKLQSVIWIREYSTYQGKVIVLYRADYLFNVDATLLDIIHVEVDSRKSKFVQKIPWISWIHQSWMLDYQVMGKDYLLTLYVYLAFQIIAFCVQLPMHAVRDLRCEQFLISVCLV